MNNLNSLNPEIPNNIILFPTSVVEAIKPKTPGFDALKEDANDLDVKSKYPCTFDYEIYKNLELRFKDKPIHGGTVMKTVFRLANSHSTCQQCLYSFEIDTYGRGCVHECAYCYAKAELTVHGMWNNPIPVPVDLNEIRRVFYTAFETDKKNKWADILRKRIPIRIGSMSDSFMWLDQKYKVTQELLKILKFYNYPYIIFTRSDLVAHDDYLPLLDPKLCSVQFSISSTNDQMLRKMEPGAPSAKRRLLALKKLAEANFWTTVRINPLFPIYPDGYFTDPNFSWNGPVPKFEFSSFEMVDEIADAGVPSVLAGFGRFSRFAVSRIESAVGMDLKPYFNREKVNKSVRDYHFSDAEIRFYYEEIKRRAQSHAMEFGTCYIGNGEKEFWGHQDLWSNKKDCCNVRGRVPSFQTDSRSIPFEDRLKFTNHKDSKPIDPETLHKPLGENPKLIEGNLPHVEL